MFGYARADQVSRLVDVVQGVIESVGDLNKKVERAIQVGSDRNSDRRQFERRAERDISLIGPAVAECLAENDTQNKVDALLIERVDSIEAEHNNRMDRLRNRVNKLDDQIDSVSGDSGRQSAAISAFGNEMDAVHKQLDQIMGLQRGDYDQNTQDMSDILGFIEDAESRLDEVVKVNIMLLDMVTQLANKLGLSNMPVSIQPDVEKWFRGLQQDQAEADQSYQDWLDEEVQLEQEWQAEQDYWDNLYAQSEAVRYDPHLEFDPETEPAAPDLAPVDWNEHSSIESPNAYWAPPTKPVHNWEAQHSAFAEGIGFYTHRDAGDENEESSGTDFPSNGAIVDFSRIPEAPPQTGGDCGCGEGDDDIALDTWDTESPAVGPTMGW